MENLRERREPQFNVQKESKPKLVVVPKDDTTNLKFVYKGYTKKILLETASLLDIIGRFKMNKDDLVEAIYDKITNYRVLKDILVHCKNDQWNLFCEVFQSVENSFLSKDDPRYLTTRGILIAIPTKEQQQDFKLILPNEIRVVLEGKTPGIIETVNRVNLVRKYIRSMVTLYGAIEIDKAVEIFNRFNDDKTDALEMQSIRDGEAYLFSGDYLIATIFQDEEKLKTFLQIRRNKKYYIPSENQFLQYGENKNFENNPQRLALKGFLMDTSSEINEEEINQIIDEVQLNLAVGNEFYKVMNIFNDRNIVFNNEQDIKVAMSLVLDISNTTRLWLNKGYTPRENHMADGNNGLMYTNPMNIPIKNINKIGRNETCPCGSGKKYKKCCM